AEIHCNTRAGRNNYKSYIGKEQIRRCNMFSKKAMRIICLVVAIAMFVPICISIVAMFTGVN
ncbi:MAG: hypothetical protein MR413_07510, partial [Clostridia bacterium]|nr:hypothetical protein [Clostridia bacterium]